MSNFLTALSGVLFAVIALADPVGGPVIPDHGQVYYVPENPLAWPAETRLRAVFDIAGAPSDYDQVNPRLETVARYLNLHARAGLAPARVDAAVVLHGQATRSALGREAFEERYGFVHPDAALIEALSAAGVRFLVCGQSAAAYGFRPEELASAVHVSLSAMTALVEMQQDGFALIPWGMN